MDLVVSTAVESDAADIACLHAAVARELTRLHGRGHWSHETTERSVAWAIRSSRVLIVRGEGTKIVATLLLQSKKPWAIDKSYFTDVRQALYLTSMAVEPSQQRQGLGRRMLLEAAAIARAWPADAIRLDAYDADAGAGGFYAKCGYREVGRASYRGTPLIYYELLL